MTGRELSLHGVLNVRDLGGLPTGDGHRVRRGLVLRAASLAGLTAGDLAVLEDSVGLRTVLDLRGEAEVRRDGRGLLADTPVRYENRPIVGARSVRLDEADDLDRGSLVEHYLTYLEHSAGVIVDILRRLGDPDVLPAMIHCAAGKDRTGVVVAVLLAALGVPGQDIVDDYAATEAAMPLVRAQLSASASVRELGAVPDWVLTALPETMHALLRHLDQLGGTEEWLRDHGLTDDDLGRLRSALLSP